MKPRPTYVALVALVAALALTAGARGGGFLVGVADNEVAEPEARAKIAALGVQAVRIFLFRHSDQRALSAADVSLVTGAEATGARVFVTVTGEPFTTEPPPTTPDLIGSYLDYASDLVDRTSVRDVTVWNEPNLSFFWPGGATPAAYERLLAATYDALTPLGVCVWGFDLERRVGTIAFIRGVADAYRSSGRVTPIFYGVTHHPYPVAGEPWDVVHRGTSTFAIGDTRRLLSLLDRSFVGTGQCSAKRITLPTRHGKKRHKLVPSCTFPLLYDEAGWSTAPMNIGQVTDSQQAADLANTIRYLEGIPRLAGLFNFQLCDDDTPGGWHTGLYDVHGNPKPSVAVIEAAARGSTSS